MSKPWWQDAVIYHVYLPSFQDSNDDGFGDLTGLSSRADYLQWLGIDAVWISPFFRSRMEDFGYDVMDYYDVDPAFGTLKAFDELVERFHERGLKVILDLVVNHTSRFHPWFLEAAQSQTSERRNWYIWRDPAPGGGPPNNWRSLNAPETPGSAWQWHEPTQQYLLCTFALTQPDLNWANPQVVEAVSEIICFWLNRGVDGFRLDMIDFVGKHPDFIDEPPHAEGEEYFSNSTAQLYLPEILRAIAAIRAVTDEYPDTVLIGEVGGLMPIERLADLYGDGAGLDLPHNFRLVFIDWEPADLRAFITAYERAIHARGWPNWVLTNHDLPRASSRGLGYPRLAMLMLLTLRGTPFIYYGEELGMSNVEIPPHRQRDPWRTPETGLSRDPSRTPMQWDATPTAGFTSTGVDPWLPIPDDHDRINVAAEQDDDHSTLHLTRALISARRAHPALRLGALEWWGTEGPVLGYRRRWGHDEADDVLVLLNLSPNKVIVDLPADTNWRPVVTTHGPNTAVQRHAIPLAGHEGILLRATTIL